MENQKVTAALLSKNRTINNELMEAVRELEIEINRIDGRGMDVMEDIRQNKAKQSPTLNDLLLVEGSVQEMLVRRLNVLVCRLSFYKRDGAIEFPQTA